MMAMTIFMHQAPGSVKRSLTVEFEIKLLHNSMEYSNLLGYKRRGVSRRARGIKNGAGPLRDPRRRDIAPTGELAGLPARDAPKSSESLASPSPLGETGQMASGPVSPVRTRNACSNSNIHTFPSPAWPVLATLQTASITCSAIESS